MILLNSGPGNYIYSKGKKYSYFGGNNYLGLAGHPEVKRAACDAIEKYGVNFSASRRTSGTADIHLELEKAISDFKGNSDSVVFASGYMGNAILLEALAGKFDAVIADENCHSSIRTAVQGSGSRIFYYEHCNPRSLDLILRKAASEKPLVMTDGIFALTGEIAPLDEIYQVVRLHNGILTVDDAHATGVLGNKGRGTPEYFSLPLSDNLFQTETMSKAIGSYGGFISAGMIISGEIREKSSAYQASTALAPPVVAAGIAALRIMREMPELRLQLLERSEYIRKEIKSLGFATTDSAAPIIPLIFDDRQSAMSLFSWLEDKGIIVPLMNYPSLQKGSILRIAVTAVHDDVQSDELLQRLMEWKSAAQQGST